MMALKCPCCGQPAPEDGRTWLFDACSGRVVSAFGEVQVTAVTHVKIMEALVAAKGKPVSTDQLIFHIYGGRDEPDSATSTTKVQVHFLKHKLRRVGVEIETLYGRGWRIDPRQELRAPQAAG
ncbi:MAG: Transcriptional regulatory protein terminal [Verrucomicrobiota bacterium]